MAAFPGSGRKTEGLGNPFPHSSGAKKRSCPVGCSTCGGSGYKGRVGIYEALRLTGALRAQVGKRSNTDEIREAARRDGMLTLKDYGVMLLKEGLTSTDEVLQCVVVQE